MRRHTFLFAFSLLLAPGLMFAEKKAVLPPGASTAGPYSPGILSNGTLYVAGQIGRDAKGNIPDNFEEEVKACLDNIDRILKEAGVTAANAVAVQVYLTDMPLNPVPAPRGVTGINSLFAIFCAQLLFCSVLSVKFRAV